VRDETPVLSRRHDPEHPTRQIKRSGSVYEILKDILVGKLKVSPDQVTLDATKEDIELDSLAVVELSMLFQSELGLTISDDELIEVLTVGDIVDLMEARSLKV
jgi:acyl carrier protein